MEQLPSLTFEVQPERRDYLELWKCSPIRFISWILYVIAALCFYWALATLVDYGYSDSTESTIIWFGADSLFAILVAVCLPHLRSSIAFRGPALRNKREISVAEHGLDVRSELMNANYRWKCSLP